MKTKTFQPAAHFQNVKQKLQFFWKIERFWKLNILIWKDSIQISSICIVSKNCL